MRYNLYYTLNNNLPNTSYPENKKKEIIEQISSDKSLKSDQYILLILEHACSLDENVREDILKGILPYGIYKEDAVADSGVSEVGEYKIFIDEKQLPDKIFYVLEKALAL